MTRLAGMALTRRAGMAPRRFAWMLQARGPEIATWPLRERLGAMALLRRCPASRERLAEALAAEDAPAFDALALDRVTCPVRRALAPLLRGLRWGAIAACLAGGLYLGAITTPDAADPAEALASADLLPVMHPSMPATVLAALER